MQLLEVPLRTPTSVTPIFYIIATRTPHNLSMGGGVMTRRLNFVSLCLLESSSCESHSLVSVLYFFACVRVSLKLALSHENKIKRVFVFVGSCNFIYAFSFTLFSLKQLFTSVVMKINSYLWSLVNYSSMLIPTLELGSSAWF